MTAPKKRFIKSASTATPVGNSAAELERILTRYGCQRFAVSRDLESGDAAVTFTVPDSGDKGAAMIPVRLEIRARLVYDAMYGRPMRWGLIEADRSGSAYDPKGYQGAKLEQASRVAWRQLVLWVDAALSSASAGLYPLSEAFFAFTVIGTPDGPKRIIDHVNDQAAGNWRALLAPPKGV